MPVVLPESWPWPGRPRPARPTAWRSARSAIAIWLFRRGCPGTRPHRAAASPGGNARQRRLDDPDPGAEAPRRGAHARRTRPEWSGTLRESIGDSSTSMGRRRRRRARSRQALTVSRCSQASKRAGSRSPGRSRQARMRLSWTASWARSGSRRISRAAASSRRRAPSTSSAKAS